jgi:hypothetical protein
MNGERVDRGMCMLHLLSLAILCPPSCVWLLVPVEEQLMKWQKYKRG